MTAYLVMGETGEYADLQTWVVRVYAREIDARSVCHALNSQAATWKASRSRKWDGPPHGWSQLDPHMRMDYTGTTYTVQPVEYVP